jgi:hypothetical protein
LQGALENANWKLENGKVGITLVMSLEVSAELNKAPRAGAPA